MLRIELMTLLLVALAVSWSVTMGLEPETNTEPALQSGNGDSSSASSADGDSDHHCVWFDKCGPDPDFNDNVHPLNCLYEGKAGKCLHQTN